MKDRIAELEARFDAFADVADESAFDNAISSDWIWTWVR